MAKKVKITTTEDRLLPDDEKEELIGIPEGEQYESTPEQDLAEAMGALSGGVSEIGFQLFRTDAATGEMVYLASLTKDQIKPEVLKSMYGGGKYLVKFLRNNQIISTVPLNIDGLPKAGIPQGLTPTVVSQGSDQNLALIISMVNNQTQLMIEQMRQDAERHKSEMAAKDKEREILLTALLNRREETDLEKLSKLAGVFKNDSSQALDSMLGFFSDMGKTLTQMLAPQSDNPLLYAIQQIVPHVKDYLSKKQGILIGGGQVPPTAGIQPQPGNGGAGPAMPASFLSLFESFILPDLLRAATEKDAEGYLNDPASFADILAFECRKRGISLAQLRQLLITEFRTKENFFARYPAAATEYPWFSDLWDEILGVAQHEQDSVIIPPPGMSPLD